MAAFASLLLALVSQDESAVRAAVSRSLPHLEKEGVAWMKERNCLSCHHVPFLLWSHRIAQSKGIPLDADKLATWTEWARKESTMQREKVRLSSAGLDALKGEGVPAETLAKLAPFAQKPGGNKEEVYLHELGKLLAPDELTQHRAALLKHATRDKGDGGGLDSMVQLLLSGSYGAGDAEFVDATRGRIRELQKADGSWKPGGQLFSTNRSAAEATQLTTSWAVLALPDADGARARSYLKDASPGKVLEGLVVRLLLATKRGEPCDDVKELLARQNADGGWASLQGAASDAFATGQALFALPVTAKDAIQRGRQFLLEQQRDDGSWPVPPAALTTPKRAPDKMKSLEPIYGYWGSAWAAIGLASTLP
ncbi:MAG TPA: prenyltransferase/squalene oxidase repeat-containing protein [Planctomycetota bacterium]|jgi:squalene-hopene/tetraprenyl-beta-curcumene cyclase|nr:prenyltransferase/squalene oxidase repeat-containing protein [Planctomycetota bacterium]